MASTKKTTEDKNVKKKKNHLKTPTKTPTKKSPSEKTPPKNSKDLIVPSSSTESQDLIVVEKDQEEVSNKTKKRTSDSSKKDKKKGKERNGESHEEEEKYRFPMGRIRRIIKIEATDLQLSQDFVFLVDKATEKFVELFTEKAYECAVRDKKKSVAYRHLSTAVSKDKRFDFLSDYVPQQVAAGEALAERKSGETKQT